MGVQLCRLCHELGLKVPEDVAIIGTDDFDVSFWADPPLSSIQPHADKIAATALDLALEMLEGEPAPEDYVRVGDSQLIVRGSTVADPHDGLDLAEAYRFIDQYAVEGISMNDVVEHTQGVSRQTFVKHFKASTGLTPSEAIRKRKIDEAKLMLRDTEISITALSRMCGFCDDTQFRRLFSKYVGRTPTAYRRGLAGV